MTGSNQGALEETVWTLLGCGKGILAMDESTGTCNARLGAHGIPTTLEARRDWRELLLGTPSLDHCISGVILYDETIRQAARDGTPFLKMLADARILAGIKVDIGAKPLAGHPSERVTEGLDGLRARLAEYFTMGARFAKWRAVISLADGGPSLGCVRANASALARYAALCQEAGMVPIVEPEVLMDGVHTMDHCRVVTEATLREVFDALYDQGVYLEGMILKPNMLLPGLDATNQESAAAVALTTVESLRRVVPAGVGGIAFLSGGQTPELASTRLNAMNSYTAQLVAPLPWVLAFSFARAIQEPAMAAWGGKDGQRALAQAEIYHRASCNQAAMRGAYDGVRDAPAKTTTHERTQLITT